MKKILPFFSLLICSMLFAQGQKIQENVQNYLSNGSTFKQVNLFERTGPNQSIDLSNSLETASILSLNQDELSKIYTTKPLLLQLNIPYEGQNVSLLLYKKDIFAEGFNAFDQDQNNLDYRPGVYYRGIVQGSTKSVVALSFFKNSVYGIASSMEAGNLNIGKLKDRDEYVIYAEHSLKGENPFVCGFDDVEENIEKMTQQSVSTQKQSSLTTNCARVYYEVGYQPYLENGSDETTTINWVTSLHNNISTLYANDNIQIAMSEVLVWKTDDPYDYDYSGNLNYFRNFREVFNGDLGHLVNQPSTTSVAYLDSLCSDDNYAYSAVSQFFNDVPTYSWSVGASTHELGHAFGSPHTHACYWNGNNTAIDGCGDLAGFSEGCSGPIPNNGGTIMSYCHLLSTGVNLASGFGQQPATLIQNTIDSKPCLGTDCINSCFQSVEEVTLSNITGTSATIEIVDNIFTEWDYKFYPYGSNPTSWSTITSSTINVNNLTPNSYYVAEVANLCTNGNYGGITKRIFLTDGDYCNGDTFTDTGGNNGNYGNDELIFKTFYPENPGDVLTLTFTEFDLEEDYDFMFVIDDSEADTNNIFPNGNNLTGNTIPGPFTATNPDGAITVVFYSDYAVGWTGWEANFTCQSLSTKNFNRADVSLYPNPTEGLVNIKATKDIERVELFDMSGRRLQSKKVNSISSEVSLESLSQGIYFVKVTAEGQSQTYKVIRE